MNLVALKTCVCFTAQECWCTGDQIHTDPTPSPWTGQSPGSAGSCWGHTSSIPCLQHKPGGDKITSHRRKPRDYQHPAPHGTCSAFLLSFLRNTATVASAYGKGGLGSARSEAAIVFWWCWGGQWLQGVAGGVVGDVCVRVRAASWMVLRGKEREEGRSKPQLKIGLNLDGVWSCASCFEQPQGDERCS